jgi:protein-L-isoaspartate O-methyltransferase
VADLQQLYLDDTATHMQQRVMHVLTGGYTAATLASMEDADVAGLITFIHYNKVSHISLS